MPLIKRKILDSLRAHLKAREITVLVGPRQVGKTTLLQILKKDLEQAGQKTLFFNLDFESDAVYFKSQQNFLNKLKLELGNQPGIVFIDEIQRKENAGLFLKGIYDQNLPFKFVVSGSGSLELKAKIQEPLTGRKRIFTLLPVSFEEFLLYRTDYRYEDRMADFFQVESEKLSFLLEEYLQFGGYPRIVTENRLSEKKLLMEEIFHSYVEKDIVYLMKVDRPEVFVHFIRLLAVHTGRLINYSQIAASLGMAVQTVKKYFWYAEKTFIIQSLTPFYRNPKKEITKSPTIYFLDLGLRNFSLGQFGATSFLPGDGFAFQNFIFNVIREKAMNSGWHLHFWRTKEKAEVDLVLEKAESLVPVEVKFTSLKKIAIERSLRAFIEKYQPKTALVVNLGLEETLNLNHTKIHFIPYHKLILTEFWDNLKKQGVTK